MKVPWYLVVWRLPFFVLAHALIWITAAVIAIGFGTEQSDEWLRRAK